MPTALAIATKAIGTAVALSSQGVQIISFEPFKIEPANFFQRRFSDFNTVMDVFRTHLIENLPDVISGELEALPLDVSTTIGDVVDGVQAMLLNGLRLVRTCPVPTSMNPCRILVA